MTAEYEYSRNVNTFALIKAAADTLTHLSNENESDSFHIDMSLIVMCAFTFEAYVNHVVWKMHDEFSKIERKPMRTKLQLLEVSLGTIFERSSRPFSTVTEAFEFRDLMAHGKSSKLVGKKTVSIASTFDERQPITELEERCTRDTALRVHEDVIAAIDLIHSKFAPGEYPYTYGFQRGVLRPLLRQTDE